MKKHVAHRVRKAYASAPGIRYLYRGVFIECVGYFHGEHCVCWEAIEEDGSCAFAHGWNLMTTKGLIDEEIDLRGPFGGYSDDALRHMGVSKEFYFKYKDK